MRSSTDEAVVRSGLRRGGGAFFRAIGVGRPELSSHDVRITPDRPPTLGNMRIAAGFMRALDAPQEAVPRAGLCVRVDVPAEDARSASFQGSGGTHTVQHGFGRTAFVARLEIARLTESDT